MFAKRYFFLFTLIAQTLFFSISFGQLNVCVYDRENHEGIAGSSLFSENNQLLGYTDEKGCLRVDTSQTKTILISSYFHKVKTVDVPSSSKVFKVFLEPKFNALKTVTISSSKFADSLNKIPQNVAVFQAKDIEVNLKGNTADVLENSGKVYVQKSQLGGGSPVLRGFEANRVLLVVDGIRMNTAIYRSGHLQNIMTLDPLNQDQIDVVYGPSSTVYGSDAMGGTIHFHSKKNEYSSDSSLLIGGNLYSHYGSAANEKRIHGLFKVADQKWSNITSLSLTDYDDLRSGRNVKSDTWLRNEYIITKNGEDLIIQNDDPYKQITTGYQQYDFSTKFGFKPNKKAEHIFAFQMSNSSDVPRYDRLAEYNGDTLKYARWDYGPQKRILAYYKLLLDDSTRFYDHAEMILSYQNVQESRINRRFGNLWETNREENVDKFALNLNLQKNLNKKSQIQYGIELTDDLVNSRAFQKNIMSQDVVKTNTRYPDGGSSWFSSAVYGYYKKELKPKLYLDAGARISFIRLKSQFDDTTFYRAPVNTVVQNNISFNWTLGLTKRYASGWTLAALTSSGFRAPNIDDVGKVFDSQPGNVVIPNSELKPEKIYNFEFRINKKVSKTEVELTPFISYMTDVLVVADFQLQGQDSIVYDGVLSKVQANTNTGQALVYGASFFISHRIVKSLKAKFNLTYTYGRDISDELPLGHIPPMYGNFSLLHSLNSIKVKQELSVLFNSEKKASLYNPNTDKLNLATPDGLAAWWTLNYRLSWRLNNDVNIIGRVENILDLHYRTFGSGVNASGRNFQLGALWRF